MGILGHSHLLPLPGSPPLPPSSLLQYRLSCYRLYFSITLILISHKYFIHLLFDSLSSPSVEYPLPEGKDIVSAVPHD